MARASIVIVQAGSGYALGGSADIQIVQNAIRFVQSLLRGTFFVEPHRASELTPAFCRLSTNAPRSPVLLATAEFNNRNHTG